MMDGALWVLGNLLQGYLNLWAALSEPSAWLSWLGPFASGTEMSVPQKEALARFIYYGGSVELFFAMMALFLAITAAGLAWRPLLWGVTRGLEGFANTVGRIAAWAGLIMVLQQVMIVFLQRIFRVFDITFSPFGIPFQRDLSWWSEELKLYNAAIVTLCCAYTFVQGGHVRVDLVYAGLRHRSRRIIDMLGSMLFLMPSMVLIWLYAWYFLWRHMVTPKINATDSLEATLRKARALRENIETIAFSPNGFDQYWLFKILMVAFAGMMILHAWAFFYRSLLEMMGGEASAGRGLDSDREDDPATLPAH